MKTSAIVTSVIIVAILGLGGYWWWSAQDAAETVEAVGDVYFYYGNTCPHCKDAEKWMEENDIESQITVVKKEVYNNRGNAKELASRALSCGYDISNGVGVPFAYIDEACYLGMPDVINAIDEKVKQMSGVVDEMPNTTNNELIASPTTTVATVTGTVELETLDAVE